MNDKQIMNELENIKNSIYSGDENWIQALDMAISRIEYQNKIIDAYATSARVIALWLEDYCDSKFPYAEMIADASRKASLKLDYYKDKFKEMEKDIKRSCETCKRKDDCDIGGKCMFQGFDYWEWRGKI